MALIAVSNSSPLILLGAAGHLGLLKQVFDEVWAPPEVQQEVHRFPSECVHVVAVRNRALLDSYATQVDLGEAAAIALAVEQPGYPLLIDDRKGRRLAIQLKLPVVGTLGLVIGAKVRGIIPAARPIVDDLLENGLYLSQAMVSSALAEVGEKWP